MEQNIKHLALLTKDLSDRYLFQLYHLLISSMITV